MSTAPQTGAPPVEGKDGQFPSVKSNSTEANIQFAKVTQGHWIGPMALSRWRATHMPTSTGGRRTIHRTDFSAVKKAKSEREMYEPFVRCILQSGILPRNAEIYISADKESNTSKLRPDIGIRVYEPGHVTEQWRTKEVLWQPFDFTDTELAIELKFHEGDDPFVDNFAANGGFESTTDQGINTRGQLAKYADKQHSVQPRDSLFQIVVFENEARLTYYDHSAAVVTEKFDYTKNPEHLADFIWSFTRATPTQRGWDPTVTLATYEEASMFRAVVSDAISTYTESFGEDVPEDMHAARDMNYPVYKSLVPDGSGSRAVLISNPFSSAPGPFGRGTRTFCAYDPSMDGGLRLLKDSWAVDHPSCLPEPTIYEKLEAASVPSLLKMICGGKVTFDGEIRKTRNHVLATVPEEWRGPCSPMIRPLVHVRLLQDLAHSVESLKNSREFVIMLRDAILALQKAYNDAGILHQDISIGNVLYTRTFPDGDVEGILNDWDHASSVRTSSDEEQMPFRSATRQFMSIDLCASPAKVHDIMDDLQSIFWVLIYGALHYIKHVNTGFLLKYPLFGYMPHMDLKRNALNMNLLRNFSFLCRPFDKLVGELADAWSSYYQVLASIQVTMVVEVPHIQAGFVELRAQMASPAWLLDKFNEALSEPDWEDDDAVGNQSPPTTEKRRRKLLTLLNASTWDISHLPEDKRQAITDSTRTRIAKGLAGLNVVTTGMKRNSDCTDQDCGPTNNVLKRRKFTKVDHDLQRPVRQAKNPKCRKTTDQQRARSSARVARRR